MIMKIAKVGLVLFLVLGAVAGLGWKQWSGGCVAESTRFIEKFDAALWKTSDMEKRTSMLRSLLDNNILHGKTPNEVIATLGAPDSVSNEQIAYVVATYTNERACGLYRHAVLMMYIGASGRVDRIVVRQD
jgi:hypothetical protein